MAEVSKLERLWATKNPDDEWWSSFVTSPMAILVNWMVVDWRWLSPNLITLFSLVTAIGASARKPPGDIDTRARRAAVAHPDGARGRLSGVALCRSWLERP